MTTMSSTTLNVLRKSMVGSHAWSMNRPDSDEDFFYVYAAPIEDLLMQNNVASKHTVSSTVDETYHEVGHVVKQLTKMNPNFLIGMLTPKVVDQIVHMETLENIVRCSFSKQIYKPVRSMVNGNYKKYIESGLDDSPKRRSQIVRHLQFGIEVLSGEQPSFSKLDIDDCDEDTILVGMKLLDEAYENSTLPETTDEVRFEQWLLEYRTRECAHYLRNRNS